ncbi:MULTISPECIES: siderophore-interacting protein [unclassified Brenneria]|uniref:siderophore-interacting protein n=1 Tax=unclassified Brenneria TaxID=2634434 RepID=UPI001557C280|nr:siderophore-interacting protein [Brenneria sp. hezel4-2-4]MEE3649923.1 siderophore-interacting protein [Brenneria sp. HEZEL_4_2_4]NPC99881.1 siderophore-interacting protein [Brenneria sp. hezel4-2-4]
MVKQTDDNDKRAPQRVRNELRFRHISVANKTRVADSFWRIQFTGADLMGFNSPGFDDHIKLFFPDPKNGELNLPEVSAEGIVWQEGQRPVGRDYTPLEFDGENSLTLDFYIHQGGVASDWAERARPGDELVIGGPRGSLIVPDDYHFQLYVCDETGLPAFKRRRPAIKAEQLHLFAYTDESTGRGYLDDLNGVDVNWLGNGMMHTDNLDRLIGALDKISLPTDDYFIWLTGESETVKRLSDYFIQRRGCDETFVRAIAYWHRK